MNHLSNSQKEAQKKVADDYKNLDLSKKLNEMTLGDLLVIINAVKIFGTSEKESIELKIDSFVKSLSQDF